MEVLQDGVRLLELHKHKARRGKTDAAKCSRGGCREWGALVPAPRCLIPEASGVTGTSNRGDIPCLPQLQLQEHPCPERQSPNHF